MGGAKRGEQSPDKCLPTCMTNVFNIGLISLLTSPASKIGEEHTSPMRDHA
jgi:hypothetical protein